MANERKKLTFYIEDLEELQTDILHKKCKEKKRRDDEVRFSFSIFKYFSKLIFFYPLETPAPRGRATPAEEARFAGGERSYQGG